MLSLIQNHIWTFYIYHTYISDHNNFVTKGLLLTFNTLPSNLKQKPQLPKKRKYPFQVDYQLGNYFKPSHLGSEKFRRKLSYKLKTFVIYSIINFEALFINHGSIFFFFNLKIGFRAYLGNWHLCPF